MAVCSSNVTSGFVDLATFDEQEKYMYGGADATAYFVREHRKSTWFTQVPVCLNRCNGTPDFGADFSCQISRSGDYLLYTWLRVTLPAITIASTIGTQFRFFWTRNLMHNLVRECCITFNDLTAARFDNYHLDFWAQFTTPAGKRNAYRNMIGDFDDLTSIPAQQGGNSLPSVVLNLPLPFFFSRDSGVALPTAALPYNDMRINFSFRPYTELIAKYDTTLATNPYSASAAGDFATAPALSNVQLWANYAIVSNDERKRMGCAPRDILIEQVQTAPVQTFSPQTNAQPSYDIRFSHSVKALFFACRNTTASGVWSNYTTRSPVVSGSTVNYDNLTNQGDPFDNVTLIYENTQRLTNMGADYFSLINPWYHAPVCPEETGYHLYSYSLDFYCVDPMGSTNYGKLTNVSVVPRASAAAVTESGSSNSAGYAQTFNTVVTCVNNNIIKCA